MRVIVFRKKFFVKDGIYRAENNISLYMAHKVITIVFISNGYYQLRIQCKFISTNFTRERHIGSTAKDIEVQYFGLIIQEDLLRCFSFETSNRCVIVYMSCSCKYKLLPEIW